MTHQTPRRSFLLGMGGLGILLATPSIVSAKGEPVAAFLGAYAYAGDDKERDARDKAIEDVVSAMNPLARGIARRKLQEATAIPPALNIAADAKDLVIIERLVYKGPLDGKPVKVRGYENAEMELSYEVSNEHILMRLKGDGKGQKNRYAIKNDKLKVHVAVFAKQLPKELSYSLTFAKP